MGDNEGRTPQEELAALDMMIKQLTIRAKALREMLPEHMAGQKIALSEAYTDDGTVHLANVRRSPGNITARLVDETAAVKWCGRMYPERLDEVVIIDPGFVKMLLEYAAKTCHPGEKGIDPKTGEQLDFIEVARGEPYVKVEPTPEGRELVAAFVQRAIPELTA